MRRKRATTEALAFVVAREAALLAAFRADWRAAVVRLLTHRRELEVELAVGRQLVLEGAQATAPPLV